MDRINRGIIGACHVVAIPFPGRGHINPMMNLCKLLVSKLQDTIKITFVVTEEWAGFIESEPRPPQIQLRSIPNVIPSELVRGSNHSGFLDAVFTNMEAPFEQLLDQLMIESPVVKTAILADMLLSWAVSVGNRRNIPLVSLWIMSAFMFLSFYHFDLLTQKRHFLADYSAERGDELIDYLPGISPTSFADMPKLKGESRQNGTDQIIKAFTLVRNAQCLLISSFHELEAQATETLREILQFPVYTVGPSIPHFSLLDERLTNNAKGDINDTDYYFKWLDSQPKSSVLYVSFGSFLSFSREQMDEIVAGLRESGVRYLLVSRGHNTSGAQDDDAGDDKVAGRSLVVPWCDQLRVLCHSSVGGFWTHCGWNSTQEALFAGVPMLTFPIFFDQIPNRKLIVDDLKVGMKVREEQFGAERLVKREEIAMIVKRFMGLNGDDDDDEGKEMRRRASELKEICRGALAKGGSSDTNINAFIRDVLLQGTHN